MSSADPVRRALERLVDSGELRADQVEPVARAVAGALREHQDGAGGRAPWSEIVAYVGGGLVLAGAAAFLGLGWDRMDQPARITVLAVITVLLLGTAAGLGRAARSATGRTAVVEGRVAATLAALGAVAAAFCTGSAVGGPDGLESYREAVSGAAGLAVAVAGYTLLPTAVGLLTCGALAVTTVAGLVAELAADSSTAVFGGFAYVALGALIVTLALTGRLVPRDLGTGMGAAVALGGGQWPLLWDGGALGYWLTAAVALACLALYARERTWVLLVSGVAGLTLAVPEAVWDWTDGAVGGAVVLVLAGAVLLTASGVGVVLHRRVGTRSRRP
ncbi:hypothetical protein FHS43_004310 [Streptosporangium becharense]|uniref:DUF2157 domain-containing protein n=1 Tax=Streptosporangium becharense TaxID=1816182 RepID=A0A7W9ICE8_9ACTN|nr:hypothetical protein [Streptosporangium becharense]MBB2913015.1 hypothetical protein [Streptosporangium becharense]MBB5818160.1 hypothetical protein [Streptosporangium becharense]